MSSNKREGEDSIQREDRLIKETLKKRRTTRKSKIASLINEEKKKIDSKTQAISSITVDEITDFEKNRKRLLRDKNAGVKIKPVEGMPLVFGYIGIFLILIGLLSLLSLFVLCDPTIGTDFYTGEVLHTYDQEAQFWWVIFTPGIVSIVSGIGLSLLIYKRPKGRLKGVEDIILLFVVWVLAILIFAVPFLLCQYVDSENYPDISYNFTQAFFEATSGLTTTGLSVMNTDSLPRILVFHRSLANFVGGVGLVLILTSAIADKSRITIYELEGHNDQLLPNLIKSARMIFIMYTVYVALGSVALYLCGCSPMDAICFSMAALSTGGLASHSESVAWFESNLPYNDYMAIEIVLIILMFLGSISFVIHYFLWKGKFKKACLHFEFLVFFVLVIIIYPFMVYGLNSAMNGNLEAAFRMSAFEFVSALTTTGFCSFNGTTFPQAYSNLPPMFFFSMLIIMAIGGQSGSTSGGLKQSRVAYFVLNMKWRIESLVMRPEMVRTHYVYRLGEKVPVSDEDIKESSNYFGLYFGVTFISTMILACYTGTFYDQSGSPLSVYSVDHCIFESISALSGIGDSCGITSFANANGQWGVLWVLILGMFIGRLEVTVFILSLFRSVKVFRSRKNVYNKPVDNTDYVLTDKEPNTNV